MKVFYEIDDKALTYRNKVEFFSKNYFLKTLIFPDHSLIQICTFKNSFINLNKSLSKTDNMALY